MSLTVMKLMLVLGIIGHALNMYCDRILSVFPNGTLKLEDIKTFGKNDKMTRLMEGVSAWCSKYCCMVQAEVLSVPLLVQKLPEMLQIFLRSCLQTLPRQRDWHLSSPSALICHASAHWSQLQEKPTR